MWDTSPSCVLYFQDASFVMVVGLQGTKAFCSGGDVAVRSKQGYVGDNQIPRLNVLDLQVSSVCSCQFSFTGQHNEPAECLVFKHSTQNSLLNGSIQASERF